MSFAVPTNVASRIYPRSMSRASAGFTLIEVMIVVVIIGILAAVAVPSYRDYITRSKITEATATLANLRIRMEQYYQDNRNYGTTATACPAQVTMPTAPAIRYFAYTCGWGAVGTTQGYTLTATGVVAEGMSGFTYTLTQSNVRATTAAPTGWTTSTNCWVTKKDGSC